MGSRILWQLAQTALARCISVRCRSVRLATLAWSCLSSAGTLGGGGGTCSPRTCSRTQTPRFTALVRLGKELVASTIRSVTNGILGVAVIQSLLASLGFWFLGLPAAGLWATIFLIAAVLQIGGLVFIPAVAYAFATYPTSHAVIFLVWCVIVGLMDNVLKPILLGRGCKVPMIVVFVGVLGGFVLMRIVGLFVGAVILSVGYKLFMAWLDADVPKAAVARSSAA